MPTENELAARLGTSRTVVREAIKILSAIGRVRAQKGRGLYVADDEGMLGSSRWGGFFLPTDLDHVYMLFEFRRVQEIGGQPAGRDPRDPGGAAGHRGRGGDCAAQGHLTGRGELFDHGDDDFHLGIAAASHNPFLRRRGPRGPAPATPVQHHRHARRDRRPRAEDAVTEHAAIYEAIRDGDPDAAAEATERPPGQDP